MTTGRLRTFLKRMKTEAIIDLVVSLNDFNKENAGFLEVFFKPEKEEKLKEKYRKIIAKEFVMKRGGHVSLNVNVTRKAINEFVKISVNPNHLADLLLFYAEEILDFILSYSEIDDPFYGELNDAYYQAAVCISNNELLDTFKDRCDKIYNDAIDAAWGFEEDIVDTYINFIDIDNEDE